MKRILVQFTFLMAVVAGVCAQSVFKAHKMTMAKPPGDPLEWLQHCNAESGMVTNVGTGSTEVTISPAVFFSKEYLAPWQDREISVISVFLCSELNNVTLFVGTGDDINAMTEVATKTTSTLAYGWNNVKLDTPVAIDASKGMCIGYRAKDNAQYPIAFDASTPVEGTSFLKINDEPFSVADPSWGNLYIRALVGGDIAALENKIGFTAFDCPGHCAKGKPLKIGMDIVNVGINNVTDFTLSYTANGVERSAKITFEEPLPPNNNTSISHSLEAITENTEYTFAVSAVNGVATGTAETISKSVEVYDSEKATERNVLIEKFTSQTCTYCYQGEVSILSAISGVEDRVVRIDHHAGFSSDIFTIADSKSISAFFNVDAFGNPMCMMDRTIQPERLDLGYANATGVVWHPGYMTPEMVRNEISKPAPISVTIAEPQWNEAERELSVKVSGKMFDNIAGAKITLVLTQSGYKAYQTNSEVGYKHNDFPLFYFTDYRGDDLTVNTDGTYQVEYKHRVGEYGGNGNKLEVDLSQLKVVAYVSDWSSPSDSKVHNAACRQVVINQTNGIDNVQAADINMYVRADRVMADGATVNVYTVSGKQVANHSLQPGVYVAKATAGNATVTRKIIIK